MNLTRVTSLDIQTASHTVGSLRKQSHRSVVCPTAFVLGDNELATRSPRMRMSVRMKIVACKIVPTC